ncbi:MAG TPA: hypothetical protein VEP90_25855 [Methylomirabilota bacterium]|nr:hypothetical protein [Methylomirabilota bacterium]
MSDQFTFQGQTAFINKPVNSVIQDFQNSYISGDGSDRDKVNAELVNLIKLILTSKDMPDTTKEETVVALHSVAEQVKEQKTNKLTVKGTLEAVKEVVSKTADIATPALAIIAAVFKILGWS